MSKRCLKINKFKMKFWSSNPNLIYLLLILLRKLLSCFRQSEEKSNHFEIHPDHSLLKKQAWAKKICFAMAQPTWVLQSLTDVRRELLNSSPQWPFYLTKEMWGKKLRNKISKRLRLNYRIIECFCSPALHQPYQGDIYNSRRLQWKEWHLWPYLSRGLEKDNKGNNKLEHYIKCVSDSYRYSNQQTQPNSYFKSSHLGPITSISFILYTMLSFQQKNSKVC